MSQTFKPSPKYLTGIRLVVTIIALAILAGGFLLGVFLSFDRDSGPGGGLLAMFIIVTLDIAWWVPAMFLTGPYYRSLSYEVQDDEVIARMGIWTQSVKHVPYRTVTNLVVKRDILDRLLGIGTLNIQTAGMSGQTGAEESLVGLPNVQEVYELVATELRRFRGGMTPTQAGIDDLPPAVPSDTLNAILAEVRAIRQTMTAEE